MELNSPNKVKMKMCFTNKTRVLMGHIIGDSEMGYLFPDHFKKKRTKRISRKKYQLTKLEKILEYLNPLNK